MKRFIAICILALFLFSGCVSRELLAEHEAEVEEAYYSGYHEGYDDGYDDGWSGGVQAGSEQSYDEFYQEGYQDGYLDGLAAAPSASDPVTRSSTSDTASRSSAALIHGVPSDTIVYVSDRSHTIHRISTCSGMKYYSEMTIAEADEHGYSYCRRCWG